MNKNLQRMEFETPKSIMAFLYWLVLKCGYEIEIKPHDEHNCYVLKFLPNNIGSLRARILLTPTETIYYLEGNKK